MNKEIEVNNIYLDGLNPRLKKIYNVEDQNLILEEILKNHEEKMFTLIKDIYDKKKLNPIDKIILLNEDNKYIVVEGNRRIASLKILLNKKMIKDINLKLFNKIKKLESKDELKEIECIVLKSREEANEWIKLRHTGENNGAGIVPWTIENRRLFDERITGKKNIVTLFLDEYKKKSNLKKEILELIPKIKITNLERILNDKDIKEKLGIFLSATGINLDYGNMVLLDKMIEDLIIRKPNVSEIYNKENRSNYLERIKNDNQKERNNKGLLNFENSILINEFEIEKINNLVKKNAIENSKNEKIINLKNGMEEKKKVFAKKRKTLIPDYFYIPEEINIPKIRNIYIELKECKLDEYPVIIGCVFRIFLELTLDYYLKSNGINLPEKKNKLLDKLRKVLGELKNKELITESDSINLENLSTNKESILSVSSFNGVIHGNYVLDSNILITAWDNYEIIFNAIYFNRNI